MKKQNRTLPSQWVLMLVLLGTFCTVAMGSVFVAWVRDPQDAFNQLYCRSFVLRHLPENADDNDADDGWGLTWYGGGETPSVLGSERRHCKPSDLLAQDALLY